MIKQLKTRVGANLFPKDLEGRALWKQMCIIYENLTSDQKNGFWVPIDKSLGWQKKANRHYHNSFKQYLYDRPFDESMKDVIREYIKGHYKNGSKREIVKKIEIMFVRSYPDVFPFKATTHAH